MALISTLGASNAQSYISVAEADAILLVRVGVGTDWSALTTPEKEAALITATRRLEQEEFASYRYTTTQALQFPRATFTDGVSGIEYLQTLMPMGVKLATAELALAVVRNPEMFDETGLEPFSQFTKGDLSLTMRDGAAKLPANVLRYLRGIRVGSTSLIRVQRS